MYCTREAGGHAPADSQVPQTCLQHVLDTGLGLSTGDAKPVSALEQFKMSLRRQTTNMAVSPGARGTESAICSRSSESTAGEAPRHSKAGELSRRSRGARGAVWILRR